MESKIEKYCDLQAVKLSLKSQCNNSLDITVVRKFLQGSKELVKDFISALNANDQGSSITKLYEWYVVFESVLQAQFYNPGCSLSDLEMVLSHLNHILYFLIRIKDLPPSWLTYLGRATLEFLVRYIGMEKHKEDFANAIAEKSYAFLCSFGQAMLKDVIGNTQRNGYQVCLLGCVFSNMDSSKAHQNSFHVAKNFLSNFSSIVGNKNQSSKEVQHQDCLGVLRHALLFYCSRPCSCNEMDHLYLVEIFRLVADFPNLRQSFLNCKGNLFHMNVAVEEGFPCDETKLLQKQMASKCQENWSKYAGSLQLTLSICHLVDCLKCAKTEIQSKAGKIEGYLETDEMEEHIRQIQRHLQQTTSQIQSGRPPQSLRESLFLLVSNPPDVKYLPTSTALAFYQLLSTCLEIFSKDILAILNNSKLASKDSVANQPSRNLAVINNANMQILVQLVSRSDLDESQLPTLAGILKSCLNNLCKVAQVTRKKEWLPPDSTAYKMIFKALTSAFTSIGSIARQLRRCDKQAAIIAILSPLWPVAAIPELLPCLSHHESLCEAYRMSDDLMSACQVIAQAACLDASLVSNNVLRTLLKMAKADVNIKVVSLFSRCQDQGLDLLLQFTKMVTFNRNSSTLAKHGDVILRHMLSTKLLSKSDEALANLLLTELSWYDHCAEGVREKFEANKGHREGVKKAIEWYQANTGLQQYDDLYAQSLFLECEIDHALLCLVQANAEQYALEFSLDGGSGKGSSNITDTSARVSFNEAPQTPLESQALTPKMADDSFMTPSTARSRTVVKIAPKKLYSDKCEDVSIDAAVPSRVLDLAQGANTSFGIWKAWYQGFFQKFLSNPALTEVEKAFRLERNLAFLQQLSQVAIVNHQPVLAVDCLSQAYSLAIIMEKVELVSEIKLSLLPILGRLGLVTAPSVSKVAEDKSAPAMRGVNGKPDVSLSDEEELDKEDYNGVNLAPLASYYYSTHRFGKCLEIFNMANKQIDDLKQKGPLTASMTLTSVELKKLAAEMSSFPGGVEAFRQLDVKAPYPLESIAEAVKYITSVAMFTMGDDFRKVLGRGVATNSWQLIHEYLSTIKLCSRLFLEVGNIKYARTYIQEGLKMAHSCFLYSWHGVFLSALANVSLNGFDSVSGTSKLIKNAFPGGTDFMEKLIDDTGLPVDAILENNSFSAEECLRICKDECGNDCELCILQPEVYAFNPVILKARIELLWTKAELLMQTTGKKADALRLLQSSMQLSSHMNKLSVRKSLQTLADQIDFKTSLFWREDPSCRLLLLEALLKIAQISFEALFMSLDGKDKGDPNSFSSEQKSETAMIKEFCRAILAQGKNFESVGKARMIIASAQFLQIQLNFLPGWCKGRDESMRAGEEAEDIDNLSEAVRELKVEEDYWNRLRLRKLKIEEVYASPSLSKRFEKESVLGKSSKFSSQQGSALLIKTEESTPCRLTKSESPQKRKSPLFESERDSSSHVDSSKKQNIQKATRKQTNGKSATSNKAGSRAAVRNRQPKPSPVLSIEPSSLSVYDDIEEDGSTLVMKPTSLKDNTTASAKTQKNVKGGRKKKVELKEKSPLPVEEMNEGNELSPLSKELSKLNLNNSPEQMEKIDSEKNTCAPQKRGMRNKKKETDEDSGLNEITKPVRRTGRGKRVLKTKDINLESTLSSSVEHEALSPSKGIINDEAGVGINPNANVSTIKNTKSNAKRQTKASRDLVTSESVETKTITRQRRRRKSPAVDSPEKKRDIEGCGEDYDHVLPLLSSMQQVSYSLLTSPHLTTGDFDKSRTTNGHWHDESPIERMRFSPGFKDVHSPLITDSHSDQLLDSSEVSLHPRVTPNELLFTPVIKRLWSPVEIPRGRPRKIKQDVENTHDDSCTQIKTSRRKKKSPAKSLRETKRKSVETARGLDDDGEKENFGTPDFTQYLKSDLQSRSGRQSRRAGTSKLSLKKSKLKNNDSAYESLEQASKHISPGEVVWSSDDDNYEPKKSFKVERSSLLVSKDDLSKSNISSESIEVVCGNTNVKTEENTQVKLSRRGPNRNICSEEKSIKNEMESCTDERNEDAEEDGEMAHRVKVNFLTACSDERLEMEIQQSLDDLKSFPPSFLHGQLSRWLALCRWNRSLRIQNDKSTNEEKVVPTSIAALLTDSLHISFYHMLTRNLHHKLRRCRETAKSMAKRKQPKKNVKKDETTGEWSALDKEEVENEMGLLNRVLDMRRDDKSVEENFKTRLQNIPEDWTVVQISSVNFDVKEKEGGQILITRMTPDAQPLTVGIPLDRWKHLSHLIQASSEAVQNVVNVDSPEEYWTRRYKRDKDLKDLVYLLQEEFLCGHKWLLCGKPLYLNQDGVKGILDQAVVGLEGQLAQWRVDADTVKVVLESLLAANEKEVESVLQCMWPSSVAMVIAATLWEVQAEVAKMEPGILDQKIERKPVILLLDKVFNQLPWECMPILSEDTVTRMPSLAALDSLHTMHSHRPDSPYLTGVSRQDVIAVIDPETNLQNSVNVLRPQFEKYKGWTCITQQLPTVTDLMSFLKQELYIYNGHGWGRQFVCGDELQMFRARAVAIIMGCHSGKMEFKSRTDGDGAPLYFLLAGCPTVLGNLWLVTDKDIDKLTSHMMSTWMSQKGPVSLSHLLNQARNVCKLQGLNGYAPVIYGLPVTMN